ncbi:MAG: hypothetical protein WCS96_00505 [Victivallales bacterium]
MDIYDQGEMWSKALPIRCERCGDVFCPHSSPDPFETLCWIMDAAGHKTRGSMLEAAVEWATYGFCPLDAAEWIHIGVFEPVVAHRMVKAAVDPNDLKRIIDWSCKKRTLEASIEQQNKGGNTDEVRKRGENIPQAAAR